MLEGIGGEEDGLIGAIWTKIPILNFFSTALANEVNVDEKVGENSSCVFGGS